MANPIPTRGNALPLTPPGGGTGIDTREAGTKQDTHQDVADRTIRPGDGVKRRFVLSHAERAKRALQYAALPVLALAALAAGVLALPLALTGWVAGKLPRPADFRAAMPVEVHRALTQPRGGLEADSAIMNALYAYAARTGCTLSAADLHQLVTVGQNLALALERSDHAASGSHDGSLHIAGHSVRCNGYFARALSWYWMAVAASQQQRKSPTAADDLLTRGSIVQPDPGQRIYRFLRSAAVSQPRVSTHFRSRSMAEQWIRVPGIVDAPQQFGIEDMQSRFPGAGGAMLFDTLRGEGMPHLFVRFEEAGCPAMLPPEPASTRDQAAYIAHAFHRNAAHIGNYATTRRGADRSDEHVERMEHIHKGNLKKPVYEPFRLLLKEAVRAGVIEANTDAIDAAARRDGMPFVVAAAERIERLADDLLSSFKNNAAPPDEDAGWRVASVKAMARTVRLQLEQVCERFDTTLDSIERQADEVHLDVPLALAGLVLPPELERKSRGWQTPVAEVGSGNAPLRWHPILEHFPAPDTSAPS